MPQNHLNPLIPPPSYSPPAQGGGRFRGAGASGSWEQSDYKSVLEKKVPWYQRTVGPAVRDWIDWMADQPVTLYEGATISGKRTTGTPRELHPGVTGAALGVGEVLDELKTPVGLAMLAAFPFIPQGALLQTVKMGIGLAGLKGVVETTPGIVDAYRSGNTEEGNRLLMHGLFSAGMAAVPALGEGKTPAILAEGAPLLKGAPRRPPPAGLATFHEADPIWAAKKINRYGLRLPEIPRPPGQEFASGHESNIYVTDAMRRAGIRMPELQRRLSDSLLRGEEGVLDLSIRTPEGELVRDTTIRGPRSMGERSTGPTPIGSRMTLDITETPPPGEIARAMDWARANNISPKDITVKDSRAYHQQLGQERTFEQMYGMSREEFSKLSLAQQRQYMDLNTNPYRESLTKTYTLDELGEMYPGEVESFIRSPAVEREQVFAREREELSDLRSAKTGRATLVTDPYKLRKMLKEGKLVKGRPLPPEETPELRIGPQRPGVGELTPPPTSRRVGQKVEQTVPKFEEGPETTTPYTQGQPRSEMADLAAAIREQTKAYQELMQQMLQRGVVAEAPPPPVAAKGKKAAKAKETAATVEEAIKLGKLRGPEGVKKTVADKYAPKEKLSEPVKSQEEIDTMLERYEDTGVLEDIRVTIKGPRGTKYTGRVMGRVVDEKGKSVSYDVLPDNARSLTKYDATGKPIEGELRTPTQRLRPDEFQFGTTEVGRTDIVTRGGKPYAERVTYRDEPGEGYVVERENFTKEGVDKYLEDIAEQLSDAQKRRLKIKDPKKIKGLENEIDELERLQERISAARAPDGTLTRTYSLPGEGAQTISARHTVKSVKARLEPEGEPSNILGGKSKDATRIEEVKAKLDKFLEEGEGIVGEQEYAHAEQIRERLNRNPQEVIRINYGNEVEDAVKAVDTGGREASKLVTPETIAKEVQFTEGVRKAAEQPKGGVTTPEERATTATTAKKSVTSKAITRPAEAKQGEKYTAASLKNEVQKTKEQLITAREKLATVIEKRIQANEKLRREGTTVRRKGVETREPVPERLLKEDPQELALRNEVTRLQQRLAELEKLKAPEKRADVKKLSESEQAERDRLEMERTRERKLYQPTSIEAVKPVPATPERPIQAPVKPTGAMSVQDRALANLRDRLATVEKESGPNHPDAIGLRKKIANMEQRLQAATAPKVPAPDDIRLVRDTLKEHLKLAKKNKQESLAVEIQRGLDELDAKYDFSKAAVAPIPPPPPRKLSE